MSFQEVLAAHRRVVNHIHKTPVTVSETINNMTGRQVFFKGELFQKTGSFKARGALNAVLHLKETDQSFKGVVTHSSGNHGQALAWAAKLAGMKCSVVVPENSAAAKVNAIKNYGADIIFCKPNLNARTEACDKIAKEKNYSIIPPYDHNDVISGQGTIAIELLEQVPDLDAIIIPISGGGMSSGMSIVVKHLSPSTKIFTVEPEGKELEKSFKAGERLWPESSPYLSTIADGLRVCPVGKLTFPILCKNAEKKVFTVSDEKMIEAMKFVWQRMKLLIEVSSATGVAAVLSDEMKAMDPSIKKVAVILCGGNVDIDALPWYKK